MRFGSWVLGIIVVVYVAMLILDPAKDERRRPLEPSPAASDLFGSSDWLMGSTAARSGAS